MITQQEVALYLDDLRIKIDIWSLLFRSERDKNLQTMLALELTGDAVKKIVRNLEARDYVEGPNADLLNKGPELWVFGKEIKKNEVYIKITLGFPNAQAICISFHIAEFPLKYPLKNKP